MLGGVGSAGVSRPFWVIPASGYPHVESHSVRTFSWFTDCEYYKCHLTRQYNMLESEDFDHVYDVFEDGSAAVSKNDQYFVYTADGKQIEVEERNQARQYAGLRILFGDIPLLSERGVVPVEVAVDNKPAVAMYLFTAHYPYYTETSWWGESVRKLELANTLNVSSKTVQKYLSRTANRFLEKKVGGERDRFYLM